MNLVILKKSVKEVLVLFMKLFGMTLLNKKLI